VSVFTGGPPIYVDLTLVIVKVKDILNLFVSGFDTSSATSSDGRNRTTSLSLANIFFSQSSLEWDLVSTAYSIQIKLRCLASTFIF
jgi:hypothetical protein